MCSISDIYLTHSIISIVHILYFNIHSVATLLFTPVQSNEICYNCSVCINMYIVFITHTYKLYLLNNLLK